jgi:hypothetical protein
MSNVTQIGRVTPSVSLARSRRLTIPLALSCLALASGCTGATDRSGSDVGSTREEVIWGAPSLQEFVNASPENQEALTAAPARF